MKERELWLPNRDQRVIKVYSGEFKDISLDGLQFQLPEKLMEAFRNRNDTNAREFYTYRIKDEDNRYVSLFDDDFINRNRIRKLKRSDAFIITPDDLGFVFLHPSFTEYLGLTDKITVEGYDEVIKLWNPKVFLEYSKNTGVEFTTDLADFQKQSYKYLKG